MTLIGSSRMARNETMRAKAEASIRQLAASKTIDETSSGRLAQQALIDPSSVSVHFLARLAVNPALAAEACNDCGYSEVPDSDIDYVVTSSWDAIANLIYPPTPDPEPAAA